MNNSSERIVILVDMDCFYVQVEQKLAPEFMGKPCVVAQYNAWKGGGIIAVNYEARACGVTRSMRGDEAKTKCPDLHLFRVREERGKANLDKYRDAGAQVMKELCSFSEIVERASIDEAYLDVTDIVTQRMAKTEEITPKMLANTFVIGFESAEEKTEDPRAAGVKRWLETSCVFNHNDKRLAVAGILAEEIRETVYKNTGYRCSAGIAHNKVLAKLIAGLHKPNGQTILPFDFIAHLYETIPIHKVRSLGGKFGAEIKEKLGIQMMSELATFSENELHKHFGDKNGSYLYNLARGIENDPVTARQLSKSIGCGKNFPGKTALGSRENVSKWLTLLTQELVERLNKDRETNHRTAQLLTISISRLGDKRFSSMSKSMQLFNYDTERIISDAMKVLDKFSCGSNGGTWIPPLTNLSLSAGKFQDTLLGSTSNIQSYFSASTAASSSKSNPPKPNLELEINNSSNSAGTIEIEENLKKDNSSLISFFSTKEKDNHDDVKLETSRFKGFFAKKSEGNVNEKDYGDDVKFETSSLKSFFGKKSEGNVEEKDHGDEVKFETSPLKSFFGKKSEGNVNEKDHGDDVKFETSSLKSFFGKKSEGNVEEKDHGDEVKFETSPLKGFFAKKNDETVNKPKPSPIKSFFARKIEELKNSSKGDLDLSNDSDEVTKTKIAQFNDDTSSRSSESSKGFFARKMEEMSFLKINESETDNPVATTSTASNELPNFGVENDEFYACDDCDKRIPLIEVEDHLDFHFAQKLQKEMRSGNSATQNDKRTTITLTKNSNKRKPNLKSKKRDPKKSKTENRTLDFYLK